MLKISLMCFVLFVATFVREANCEPEECEQCVPVEKCTMFEEMSKREQDRWIEDHPCKGSDEEDLGVLFGFAPAARGDYVCCSYSNMWGVEEPGPRSHEASLGGYDNSDDEASIEGSRIRNPSRRRPNRPRYNNPGNRPNERITNGANFNEPRFNNPGNNFNRPNNYGPNVRQCSLSSSPPTPQSGCCGLDITGDRATGGNNNFMNRPGSSNHWNPPSEHSRRFTRDTPESFGISLDSRIAGGKETDLYQYPWTVLLKTTFDYGDRQSTFNCGGSLLSSRYVLTAGHCVYEQGARVSKIDVYLAEFDKRTYPRDCVNSPEGRKCIDNILVQGEDYVIHPDYDDTRLQNDIALIRLVENVPYTEFTRPICLPPINIDNPDFSNLRLAVAGWGRNGSIPSNVKQSTVVNLVPQRQCSSSYPHLTNKHLCAAGHSGEDTCKGDSGGPLMMLYEGKYYVSGVVSGKRADAPCGTAVPSLYTNVYHYVNWILNSIRR